jgi:hypothetical protein
MKGYRLPLSEAFVYSSPEKPTSGSFRWVAPLKTLQVPTDGKGREMRYARKRKA